jgi:arsenite methyltransferase
MNEPNERNHVHEVVRARYGEIARSGQPIPEAGCCGPKPETIAAKIGYRGEEIAGVPQGANLGLGCGAPLQFVELREGETVLDLGSGAGFDAFLAARVVGDHGHVIGVDMTPEMLERARHNAKAGGYANVEFREGRIESLPVDDSSIDAVISNCVINLVPDKAAVYREIARVLRPGGRVVVSDIVVDAALPAAIAGSVAALTGCVAGAALRAEYLAAIGAAGLGDIEILKDTGFGELVEDFVPADMREDAEAHGIDVHAVARTVRSITVRATKPAAS